MTLNIIIYTSTKQTIFKFNLLEFPLLQELHKTAKLLIIPAEKINDIDRNYISLILLLDKNSTIHFKRQYEDLPRPILFLISEKHQNLPMILEASTWLNSNSIKNEILYGDVKQIKERIKTLEKIFTTGKRLINRRIGIIEKPSNHLISSNVDYFLTKRRWGVDFIDIPIETNRAPLYTEDFIKIKKPIPQKIDFYKILLLLIRDKRLSALALDLTKVPNQLISSLVSDSSKLSQKNFPIAFDTDPQLVFTMLALKLLLGKTPIITYPIQVSTTNNQLILSSYPGSSEVFNNFNRDSKITLLKCGGLCLDQFYLSTSTFIKKTILTDKQKTILTLHLDNPVVNLLKKPLGYHYLIFNGNHNDLINEFFVFNHCIKI